MKVVLMLLALGVLTGCADFNQRDFCKSDAQGAAAVGILYGQATTMFTSGEAEGNTTIKNMACQELKEADELAVGDEAYKDGFADSFNGVRDLRAYCTKAKAEK